MTSVNQDGKSPRRIAIIGSGISGLVCAYLLHSRHEVTLFEAEERLGGHTATKVVNHEGVDYNIDTGFIVFNDRTYPQFIKLMSRLGVDSQPTQMGFSVTSRRHGVEYSGTSISGLFAQFKNVFNWRYWRMLREILRFNAVCIKMHENQAIPDMPLGDYLASQGFSEYFSQLYILPMVSAIWSSGMATAAAMPLKFFIQFFYNHGLLTVTQQPQWYTIKGGSKTYIEPLTRGFSDRVITNCPILWVKRDHTSVVVASQRGEEVFDEVIFACHSDQALKLLVDPSPEEFDILSAIPYQANDVCLHTDHGLLPSARAAWASWNYRLPNAGAADAAVLTYNMNILQGLSAPVTFCVSVNAVDAIDPEKIIGKYSYSHPVFTQESVAAQDRWAEISGQRNTHFCGAYWRNGFHEDGVVSALRIAATFGEGFSW